MINICTECQRLNPLELIQCHYCGGQCEKISNARLNTCMIEFTERKRQKREQEKNKKDSKEEENARGQEENVQRHAENGV